MRAAAEASGPVQTGPRCAAFGRPSFIVLAMHDSRIGTFDPSQRCGTRHGPTVRAAGRNGGDLQLLEAGVLPARGRRLRVLAAQRPTRQERPRPAEDRQARRRVAGQGRRTRHVPAQPGAAQADPAAARCHPLSAQPGPRSDAEEAAAGEDAGRRADQTRLGDQRPARRVRPHDAGRHDRRTA